MDEKDYFDIEEFPDDDDVGGAGPDIPSAESLGIQPIEKLMAIEDTVASMGLAEQIAPGDGRVEDDAIYDDTQIETITDGTTTVTDTDKLTVTAGAGITAVIAQDGVAEKGDAILTITNTDPGSAADDIYIGTITHTGESVKVEPCDKITFVAGAGITAIVAQDGPVGNNDATVTITNTDLGSSASDVRIGTITDDSTTVAPCDKITFVGATVAQDGAVGNNDATVTINSSGTGFDKYLDVTVDINATVSANIAYLDSTDWRGRVIQVTGMAFVGTPADSNTNPWNDTEADPPMVRGAGQGKLNTANNDCRVFVMPASMGLAVSIWCEDNTGYLYIVVTNYTVQTQMRFMISASAVRDTSGAADLVVS